VNFASTQVQAKEVAPPASNEGSQDEAAPTKPLSASPPLTADGVDNMYYQLVEIHTTATAQLGECARWRRSDSTPSPARARVGRLRPVTMPSMISLAPSPAVVMHDKAGTITRHNAIHDKAGPTMAAIGITR
jgi:hypothetical protein